MNATEHTLFGIFAKHWEPGRVKTRLARELGQVPAAELHRHFVETLLLRFAAVADRQVLCYSPPAAAAEFAALPLDRWKLLPQADGDLGARLRHYFETAFATGARRVVLIGSDSPNLPAAYVAEAFESLQTHPVVLGPSADGGYYLVGAAGGVPPIFDDIAWSTPQVWTQTVTCLRSAGIPFHALPAWYDVDEPADLRKLAAELAEATEQDEQLTRLASFVADHLRGNE